MLTAPWRRMQAATAESLRADAIAGVTLTVVLLPQAIAFALVAGLPPSAGLVTAVVGAVVGALWGSSSLVHTGPTSAVSLLVLSSIAGSTGGDPGTLLVAAGVLSVLAGVVQIVLGLARLGLLVNFVSDAVIIGFAAGAGVQIMVGELRHILGVEVPGRGLVTRLTYMASHLGEASLPTIAVGVGTLGIVVAVRQWRRRWPAMLIALVATSSATTLAGAERLGVAVLGALPSTVPLPQALPIFDSEMIATLSTGAFAVAAIGLIQTMAVARSLAASTGERLDANQEFVGQGLANVACGVFSGFAVSGSFSRSAVAGEAGARSPFAAVFSGAFVLLALLFLGPVGAYLPRAALAGVLLVVAAGMIDRAAILRILRGTPGESVVMGITLIGTLLLPIEVAVLSGILAALAHYVLQTSAPEVVAVVPDNQFRHFQPRGSRPQCPQLAIFDIQGDLYFGATTHVEDALRDHLSRNRSQRFLLLRMQGVNRIDVSGIRMLESLIRTLRERGGDVYLTRVHRSVLRFMIKTRFHEHIGRDRFLAADVAVQHLFHHVIDPAVCIYESDVRVFRECQTLPRPEVAIPLDVIPNAAPGAVPTIAPTDLWERLHGDGIGPRVIDVREPREFARGHVPGSDNLPLPGLLEDPPSPSDRPLVLVCRGGRRSRNAAALLTSRGHQEVYVLQGGMLAWEADHLITAV